MRDYDDFSDLIEPIMHDTHRGAFLPLAVNFVFQGVLPHADQESYLRMLRLPVSMFRRRFKPAFDDRVLFS